MENHCNSWKRSGNIVVLKYGKHWCQIQTLMQWICFNSHTIIGWPYAFYFQLSLQALLHWVIMILNEIIMTAGWRLFLSLLYPNATLNVENIMTGVRDEQLQATAPLWGRLNVFTVSHSFNLNLQYDLACQDIYLYCPWIPESEYGELKKCFCSGAGWLVYTMSERMQAWHQSDISLAMHVWLPSNINTRSLTLKRWMLVPSKTPALLMLGKFCAKLWLINIPDGFFSQHQSMSWLVSINVNFVKFLFGKQSNWFCHQWHLASTTSDCKTHQKTPTLQIKSCSCKQPFTNKATFILKHSHLKILFSIWSTTIGRELYYARFPD